VIGKTMRSVAGVKGLGSQSFLKRWVVK